MSYLVINETMSLVDQEINNFLGEFADDHPYQMALSLPYFCQMLKTKVLSKVPNRYRVLEGNLSGTFFPDTGSGLQKERLLIEEKINLIMPSLIQDIRHPQKNSPGLVAVWWIKVHTMIPCVTYFFGPFESLAAAKQNYRGYVEDLREEEAIGITVEFQQETPAVLTSMDSPSDLKQDVQMLWQHICKVKSQRLAKQTAQQHLLASLPGNYLTTDLQGIIQNANHNICQLLQLPPKEIIGKSVEFFVPPHQRRKFQRYLGLMQRQANYSKTAPCWSMTLKTPAIDPIDVDIETGLCKSSQDIILGWYWLFHNTSQLHSISQQNYYDSRHDLLTCLPNRRSLFEFLKDLIADRQSHDGSLFSLLLLDLNHFKEVNDNFGHHFGDEVLKAIAVRLLACVRDQDKVTRLGGDEFAIILEAMSSAQEAKDCAYRIHHALSHPLHIGDRQITVSSSIGIVISNGQNSDHDRLFYCADMAMYESKRNASPFVIFDDLSSEVLKLEKQLHYHLPPLTPGVTME